MPKAFEQPKKVRYPYQVHMLKCYIKEISFNYVIIATKMINGHFLIMLAEGCFAILDTTEW